MHGNFERCLAATLIHEGGWSKRKEDPGGATMKGVTIGTFRLHYGQSRTEADLRAITDEQLQKIYRTYWDAVRGDDLPSGLDLVAFDAAVNSGPARGVRWLQGAVGATVDGKAGPDTVAAAQRVSDPRAAIDRACEARMAFLRTIKGWSTFHAGWTSRVTDIRARAKAMVGSYAFPPQQPAPPPAAKPRGFLAVIMDILKGLWK